MPIDLFEHPDALEIRIRTDRVSTDGERGGVSYTTLYDDREIWQDYVIDAPKRPRKRD